MRPLLVMGNWKMNKLPAQAGSFAAHIRSEYEATRGNVEVTLFPPFISLPAVAEALAGSRLQWGAQNVHPEPDGPHTGEVSAAMLADVGCTSVLCGHSERRQEAHEDDALVGRKLAACWQAGLRPVLCVGEGWDVRQAGGTEGWLRSQLQQALEAAHSTTMEDVETKEPLENFLFNKPLVVAYEPIWAIGAGQPATASQAEQAGRWIRDELVGLGGTGWAADVPILYGGSVSPDNAAEFFHADEVDGVLVGGASLRVEAFLAIANAAKGMDG